MSSQSHNLKLYAGQGELLRTYRYPLNIDPIKAEAKKIQALFASSSQILDVDLVTRNCGLPPTFFRIPRPENSMNSGIECPFSQSDLIMEFSEPQYHNKKKPILTH